MQISKTFRFFWNRVCINFLNNLTIGIIILQFHFRAINNLEFYSNYNLLLLHNFLKYKDCGFFLEIFSLDYRLDCLVPTNFYSKFVVQKMSIN